MRSLPRSLAGARGSRAELAAGFVGALVLLAWGQPARAGVLRVELREALLEIQMDAIHQEVVVEGRVVNESRSRMMAPRLALRAGAVLFDPRILTLDFGAGMRAVRGETERLGQTDGLEEDLESYHLSAVVLGENRFSVTAMATKVDALRQLPFELPVDIQTRTTNLGLAMRRIAYPGTLNLEETESRQQARDGGSRARHDHFRSLTYRGLRTWSRTRLDSFLRRQELEDRLFPQSNNTTSSADIRFSADELSPRIEHITSNLLAFDRRGAFDETALSATGTLGLRHGPSLTSVHSLGLRRDAGRAGSGEQHSISAASGVRHELYESLTTHLRAAGSRIERSDGRADSWSGEAELTYTKRLPADGRLSLRLRGGLLERDAAFAGGQQLVAGEEHAARFGAPFELQQPNVIPGSIVITSDSGNVLFLEGIDWIATEAGLFTEIRILTNGGIADSQLVRVTYRIAFPGRLESTQVRSGAALDIHFRLVDLFARRDEVEDHANRDLARGFLGDRVSEQIGARFRKATGRFTGTASGTVERERAAITTYDQVRLGGDLSAQLVHGLVLNLGLEALTTEYSDPRRSRKMSSGLVGVGWTPVPGLSIDLRVEYRRYRDSLFADERLRSEALQVRWAFRKVTLLLVATSSEADREIAVQKAVRTFFGVSRRI